ncbi:MAG TPA: hypothetical protein VH762_18945 [Gemmatimonadaceae bacterium]
MQRTGRIWIRDVVAAAALGVALAAVAVIGHAPRPVPLSPAASASLSVGTQYLAELRSRFHRPFGEARSPASLRADALQALYLARVESGVGSPFYAVEAALRDPWLPDSIRANLASAMLADVLTISPAAVGEYALDKFDADLVDSVVRSYSEPRRGEEVVRIAFELAAASGAVSRSEAAAAADIAAMTRDAEYARRDVARLVTAAHKGGLAPLELLPLWREERRFDVERPIVYPIDWAASRELVANASRVFELLDARAGKGDRADDSTAARRVLVADFAVRHSARQVASARNAPPSPAISQVTPTLSSAHLASPATNEEELAAVWLGVSSLQPNERTSWARAVAASAVRLRTNAQARVWFAGDHAPKATEVQQRHGLSAISFAASLRPSWREFALLSLDRALVDARRVLPDLDLRGLRIHIGMKAEWPARAMALHDPESRTIYFPLGTGPGVLAHELGHDLDWQVARTVFGERGIYATDGTARRASPILAAPVERLTSASALSALAPSRHTLSARPTEILARHVDWIMAAALADMGRSNGFLSTVQDVGDALGNTSAPEHSQIDAAVSVLASATKVPHRTVVSVHRGAGRDPLVRDVVARALTVNLRMPWHRWATSALDVLGNAAAMFRQAADPGFARSCVAASARAAGEPEWIADVNALVAEARTRDVIRRLQQFPPRRPLVRDPAGRGGLATGPVDPAQRARATAVLRREIEWQLATDMSVPLVQATEAGGSIRCEPR